MKILIIYAHPEPKSLNSALKDAAVETLVDMGAEVEVSDLYAQHFEPIASRRDFVSLANPDRLGYIHEQRHASKSGGYSSDIVEEQNKIKAANLLIFQFPLWWYGVPAILKGWADRVLTHGFAYTDEKLFANGLLKGKRAMLSITTGGTAEELFNDRAYTGTVEEFLRPFSQGVLGFVGMELLPPHLFYAPASLDPAGRERQIEEFRQRLRQIAASD